MMTVSARQGYGLLSKRSLILLNFWLWPLVSNNLAWGAVYRLPAKAAFMKKNAYLAVPNIPFMLWMAPRPRLYSMALSNWHRAGLPWSCLALTMAKTRAMGSPFLAPSALR